MNNFDIRLTVSTYGIKNIRVFGEGVVTKHTFPYATTTQFMEYLLVESKYRMTENYKLTLSPCVDAKQRINHTPEQQHYYISDFNSLVRDGVYRVYVLDSDGYTPLTPLKVDKL